MAATSSYSSFASDPFLAMPASQQPSRAGPSSSSKAKSRPISISLAPLSIPSSSSQPLFNPSYIPTTQSTYLHSPPSPAPFIGVNYSPGGSAWPSSGPAQPPTPLTIPSHYGPPSPYMVARECAGLAAGPRSPCSPLRMSIDGRDDDGSSYGFASALGHRSERLSPYPLDRRPSQKDKPLQQLLRRSAGPSSMPSAGGFPFPTTPPPTPPCSSADALTALRAMVTPPSHPAYALPTPPPSGHRDDPLFPIDDDCAESVSARALAHHTLHPRFAAQYRILGELGSGGFGFVVKAIRLADKRICAVKFIIIDKVPSHSWVRVPNWDGGSGTGVGAEGGVGLIPMEAFVLRKVRHENVVSFLDLFEQGPYFYLVMEHHGTPWVASPEPVKNHTSPYALPQLVAASHPAADEMQVDCEDDSPISPIEEQILISTSPSPFSHSPPSSPPRHAPPMLRRASCDLFECIEQHKRLPEDVARYVFQQIVSCVAHLAAMGICHRDIKDENIVIDKNYKVKLIDFGSAVIFDARQPPPYYNKFWGTMNFASAEILLGKPYRAPEAEVWALGVLLCLLVVGETPFSEPVKAMEGKTHINFSQMSRSCSHLIRCCLETRPSKRITIQQMLVHPWLAPRPEDALLRPTRSPLRPRMSRAASTY